MAILENIDINMGILEHIDINLAILEHIDTYFNIDKDSLENIGIEFCKISIRYSIDKDLAYLD